jgi:hypothetical protein
MRRVRSAFAVKAPRDNDVSSSARVSASTYAAAYRSLPFSGGPRGSELDHSIGSAELESTDALNYRVFALSVAF